MRRRTAGLAAALAAALAGAQPAGAQGLGELIGDALDRGARTVGRAAERASTATGADRGLGWARRKVRGERGTGREARPGRDH